MFIKYLIKLTVEILFDKKFNSSRNLICQEI